MPTTSARDGNKKKSTKTPRKVKVLSQKIAVWGNGRGISSGYTYILLQTHCLRYIACDKVTKVIGRN